MKAISLLLPHLTTVLLIISWTCFTFYSAVVVPIGTDLFDPMHQGLITRQVTVWLNLLTGVYVVSHLAELLILPSSRYQWILWGLISASLIGLLILHPMLDELILPDQTGITSKREFYSLHRSYLWVNTLSWVAGGFLIIQRIKVSLIAQSDSQER